MKISHLFAFLTVSLALVSSSLSFAAELTADQQTKIDAKIAQLKEWAAAPAIVNAVAAQNTRPPAVNATMTQEQWKKLSVLDPIVRAFNRNEAAAFLKTQRATWMTEAFISDAKGLKVAFLSKPSNWSHATSAKHTQPMAGASWQGAVELDESTGLQQIQVSVPVLEGGKPIGSLVVGVALSNLE